MKHHFIGVDPGLVHTGVVGFVFDEAAHRLRIWNVVVDGIDIPEIRRMTLEVSVPVAHVFIEAYRPRSHFNTDARMVTGVSELAKAVPNSKVINNNGAKQIVKSGIMHTMEVWKFTQATNHQDLRSAARIGLYGALKDKTLNRVIYDYLTDALDGRPWSRI